MDSLREKLLIMPAVNPQILIWARETAGLPLDDAAHRLGIKDARGVTAANRLAALERGERDVSRPVLLKMAKTYRRPLVVFYLDAPPIRGDRGSDFRTLLERDAGQEGLVDALVRDIRARQEMVRAVLADDEEAEPLAFIGSMSLADGEAAVLQSIKRITGVDLPEFRAQASPESAFALLRRHTEDAGIFVLLAGSLGSHHTSIDVELFRGLALADPIAPFAVINDQDARPAWSFTLLHELAHLWLGATGISGSYAETRIERFCNDVASSFLLPEEELPRVRVDLGTPEAAAIRLISDFATERHLSMSMVAYRLRNHGLITDERWRTLRGIFRARWLQSRAAQRERAREQDSGPSYYVVRRHRLGNALLKFVARNVDGGTLTTTKASKVLGVRPRNVEPLLSGGALVGGRAA